MPRPRRFLLGDVRSDDKDSSDGRASIPRRSSSNIAKATSCPVGSARILQSSSVESLETLRRIRFAKSRVSVRWYPVDRINHRTDPETKPMRTPRQPETNQPTIEPRTPPGQPTASEKNTAITEKTPIQAMIDFSRLNQPRTIANRFMVRSSKSGGRQNRRSSA